MKKKEKTNCKKKKSQLKARSSTRFAALILEASGIFFDILVGEIKWAEWKNFWRSHGHILEVARACGNFLGVGMGVILRDDFYTNKRSLWNHINWILLSVGVGNTTESNCTIVGLKLYRRDFMQWWLHREKWRSSKENKYLCRRSEVVTMFVYFYLSYKRNTVKVRLVQKLQIMTKIQVFSRGSTVTYWSWGLFDS